MSYLHHEHQVNATTWHSCYSQLCAGVMQTHNLTLHIVMNTVFPGP